ncbi:MAG: hypothetical protein ABI925_10530 [Verrucomicrobiota bacterium]
MIAVTFALPAESSHFVRLLRDKTDHVQNGVSTISGKIDNVAVEILHTGVGEKICTRRLERFLQDRQFEFLISAGFAGALTDRLAAGELVFAKNFSTIAFAQPASKPTIHFADLHTAAAMIDSADARKEMARTTGAVAVDMETQFIARICSEHALPMLSLRAISDTPSDPFPAPPDVLFNITAQRTDMLKLAAFFLAHPNRIPRLIQFARRIGRAKEVLAKAVAEGISRQQV